jgi:hypothetical protein
LDRNLRQNNYAAIEQRTQIFLIIINDAKQASEPLPAPAGPITNTFRSTSITNQGKYTDDKPMRYDNY